MKLRSLLLLTAFTATLQSTAQTWVADSVEMSAGYINDVFYSMKNGVQKTQNASDWHIAFQMTKFGDPEFAAAIRANHIKGKVEVYSLHLKASTHFATLSAADTVGLTSSTMQLQNNDSSWAEGAFLQNRDPGDPFDFGWGKYMSSTSHFLEGDSLYLVKVNGDPYKLWLQQYISTGDTIGYKFRIAKFDGTNDHQVYEKRKPNYENVHFGYYDIVNNTFSNREPNRPNWDIMFTQYAKPQVFGPSGLQAYTGVLANLGVMIAEVKNVDPNTITQSNYTNYTSQLSTYPNEIGDDWKTFNISTMQYDLDANTSFIIKTDNTSEYYQIRFTRFDGGATGKTIFDKKFLATTSVGSLKRNIAAYSFAPNPANNEVSVMIDAKKSAANTQLTITDITGKIVKQVMIEVKTGLNGYRFNTNDISSGTYMITIANSDWKIADRLVVQH